MHSDSEHFTQYKGPVSVSKWSYGVTTTPVTLRRHKTNALVQAALCPWAIGRRVSRFNGNVGVSWTAFLEVNLNFRDEVCISSHLPNKTAHFWDNSTSMTVSVKRSQIQQHHWRLNKIKQFLAYVICVTTNRYHHQGCSQMYSQFPRNRLMFYLFSGNGWFVLSNRSLIMSYIGGKYSWNTLSRKTALGLEKCVQICPNLCFCPICVARNMTSQQPPFSKNGYVCFF